MQVALAPTNLDGRLSIPILYHFNGEKKICFLQVLFLDFSKISDIQGNHASTINPDGTVAPSQFIWKFKKTIDHLYHEKTKHESSKIRIRFHLLAFPESPEYRKIVFAISILSVDEIQVAEVLSSFSNVCTYYVQPKRLGKVISTVDKLDKFNFPHFSLKMEQIAKLVPKQCVKRLNFFELASVYENLPLKNPNFSHDTFHVSNGLLIGKELSGKDLIIPPVNKIFLCGESDGLHKVLIESALLPPNHIIVSHKPDFYKEYIRSNPDVASQRKMRTVSIRKYGINLMKIMRTDPPFAVRVFRSWLLLVENHPSLLDTAFNLVESLSTKSFETVDNFFDLLKNKTSILNEISVVESYLDQFLLSFEEILTLPFFSNQNDEAFNQGGLIILDCSSVRNRFHVLAIGMVLHQLRVSGYHDYSLSIPGWEILNAERTMSRNFDAHFSILQFNQFFTVFSSIANFSPLAELCELIIEDRNSFLSNDRSKKSTSTGASTDIIFTLTGSKSFIYGNSLPHLIFETNIPKVHWNLNETSFEEEETENFEETEDEVDGETLRDFERTHFKWILCYELWLSSPQTLQELNDRLKDLPISTKTTEEILGQLIEDQEVLYQDPDTYSLSLAMRSKILEVTKGHSKMSPLLESAISKTKTEYEVLDFIRKKASEIKSGNDILNSAADMFLVAKSTTRLERYSSIFFSFMFELNKIGPKLDRKSRDVLKQLFIESVETVARIISDEDFSSVKEIAEESHELVSERIEIEQTETEDSLDLSGIEEVELPNLSSNELEPKAPELQTEIPTEDGPVPYPGININLANYVSDSGIMGLKFSEFVERTIKIPHTNLSPINIDTQEAAVRQKTMSTVEQPKEKAKKVAPIPKPKKIKNEMTVSKVSMVPLSGKNELKDNNYGSNYDSLELSIPEEFLNSVDLHFQSVSSQPPTQILIRLFNECLIYPITEKRFYQPLPEIIEILSETSAECNVSIQEFTNELAQNLEYWQKFEEPEQRKEIIRQILEKFKFALETFKYSHRFREKLREKVIGDPVIG